MFVVWQSGWPVVTQILGFLFCRGEWVCTLCRNPMKPEVEYDCENTRYAHSYNAQYGLDDYDQKVGITTSCYCIGKGIWPQLETLSLHWKVNCFELVAPRVFLRIVNTTEELLVFTYVVLFFLENCLIQNESDATEKWTRKSHLAAEHPSLCRLCLALCHQIFFFQDLAHSQTSAQANCKDIFWCRHFLTLSWIAVNLLSSYWTLITFRMTSRRC